MAPRGVRSSFQNLPFFSTRCNLSFQTALISAVRCAYFLKRKTLLFCRSCVFQLEGSTVASGASRSAACASQGGVWVQPFHPRAGARVAGWGGGLYPGLHPWWPGPASRVEHPLATPSEAGRPAGRVVHPHAGPEARSRPKSTPGVATYSSQSGVWRNGSASDSRSEGWEFDSLCPHYSF